MAEALTPDVMKILVGSKIEIFEQRVYLDERQCTIGGQEKGGIGIIAFVSQDAGGCRDDPACLLVE